MAASHGLWMGGKDKRRHRPVMVLDGRKTSIEEELDEDINNDF